MKKTKEFKSKNEAVNHIRIVFPAKSANEAFSRSLIASFISHLDPTLEELCDIKTAVSEAVTNCIVHAYNDSYSEKERKIMLSAKYTNDGLVTVRIKDNGCGIQDIEKAREPLYSGSGNDERSGMGFSIMECFTDKLSVTSTVGKGTTVTLKKYIGKHE